MISYRINDYKTFALKKRAYKLMPLRGMLDEMFSNLVCKIFRVLGQSSRVSIYLVKLDYLCIRIYNLSSMCIQTLEFIITHDVRNSSISAS